MASFSRRQFVAAASVGVLSGGRSGFANASVGRSAIEKLNIGVIGVGNHGFTNLHQVLTEDVVAICDVDQKYLTAAASVARSAKPYRDYREMLQHPDLDAVVISTPDHNHAACAIRALRNGLHVFCEKPLTHNLGELKDLLTATRKTKLVTQTGVQHHSKDGYRQAAEILQAGTLGMVSEIHVWTNRPFWPQGKKRPVERPTVPDHLQWDLWLGAAPVRPYHPAYHPLAWRGWWDFGGGALADLGPHLLDPIVWGLQLSDPERVTARCSPVTRESAPNWSIVTYRFAPTATKPALKLVWYDGSKQPPRSVTKIERLPPNGAFVLGERGRLFIPLLGRAPRLLANPGGKPPEPPKPFLPKSSGHHQQWLAACRGETKVDCDFQYGARLTRLCHLGNLAIRSRQPVRWDGRRQRLIDSPRAEPFVSRQARPGWSY